MKVEPGLVNHPKFLRLKKAVGPVAMEVLIRLWGHCQSGQRGEYWRGADSDYVETVALWDGEEGKLFKALEAAKLVVVKDNGIRVKNWNQHNSIVVEAWRKGRAGGRPPVRQEVTSSKPTANQQVSSSEPVKLGKLSIVSTTDLNKGIPPKGLTKIQLDALKVQWSALNAQVLELERRKSQEGLTYDEREELREKKAARDAVQKKQAEGKFE